MQLLILGLYDFDPSHGACECHFLDGPHSTGKKFDKDLSGEGKSWHAAGQPIEVGLRHVVTSCQRDGPFDGAYGFSQGTCMLTLLSDPAVWRAHGGDDASFPPWRFVLLDTPVANAFVDPRLPRHVFVCRGLLAPAICGTDAELALVLWFAAAAPLAA